MSAAAVMLHHGLLGAAVAFLGGAAVRVASLAVPEGLERGLAAAALAAAAAIVQAIALGLAGLGGSTAALALTAAATWLLCARLLPVPRAAGRELVAWALGLPPWARLVLAAVAGAAVAWLAWLFRHPGLGYDTLLYHLPEAVTWTQRGDTGAVHEIVAGLPVGYYPVAHEVLTSWSLGLARSFVPVTLLTFATLVLIGLATWSCLRTLGAPRPVAALAAGALVASPAALGAGRTGAAIDPVALAWLATCAALGAASLRRPALLAPAVVAGGLAAGTKTTGLPLTVVVLALAGWANREHLRRLALPLAAAAVLAGLVGALWYVRNLIAHGSPFWPFLAAPWGDPMPPVIRAAEASFLERPGETLERAGSLYLEQFAGGLVLLVGAIAAPLVARRRPVAAGAAAVVLSVLLWANAPLTGVSENPGFDIGTADAVRYLLPALGAAALTLALASIRDRAGRIYAIAVLAAALVAGLYQTFELGFPGAPAPLTPLAGAAAGMALALGLSHVAGARPVKPGERRVRRLRLGAGAAVVAAGLLLAPLAPGYLSRHAEADRFDGGLTALFDSIGDDERPVGVTAAVHALAAGDHLQRRLDLIRPGESCAALERRRERGWVVLTKFVDDRIRVDVKTCFEPQQPVFEDRSYRIYSPVP